MKQPILTSTLKTYASVVHEANAKWWLDLSKPCKNKRCDKLGVRCSCRGLKYQRLPNRNVGEMLMLVVSELAEALEGHRKGLQDDKLPEYRMFDVEIIDAFIRLFDIVGAAGIDIDEIFWAKMKYNAVRKDHQIANRVKPGGKKF